MTRFARILRRFAHPTPSPHKGADDRRRWRRAGVSLNAHLFFPPGPAAAVPPPPVAVTVEDISGGGARLVAARPVPAGTSFSLECALSGLKAPLALDAISLACTEAAPDGYLVRCEFTGIRESMQRAIEGWVDDQVRGRAER